MTGADQPTASSSLERAWKLRNVRSRRRKEADPVENVKVSASLRRRLRVAVFALLIAVSLGVAIASYYGNANRERGQLLKIALRRGLSDQQRVTANINETNLAQAFVMYSELTGRIQLPQTNSLAENVDSLLGGRLTRWHWVHAPHASSGIQYHADGLRTVLELKAELEELFAKNGVRIVPEGAKYFRVVRNEKVEATRH
jgi:hypothetical protein